MDRISIPSANSLPRLRRLSSLLLLVWVIGLSGCTRHDSRDGKDSAVVPRHGYRISYVATRLKDHATLGSADSSLTLGQTATVRTPTVDPTEDTPALPQFSATLTTTRVPGVYQLVTRISIQEVARNKKGKLKRSKRYQGALLPMRMGETQLASPAGDPVQVEIRLEQL